MWSYFSYPLVFPSRVIRLVGSPIADPIVPGYCGCVAILALYARHVGISGISKILWEYSREIITQNNKSLNHMARTDFGNSQQKGVNSWFFLKNAHCKNCIYTVWANLDQYVIFNCHIIPQQWNWGSLCYFKVTTSPWILMFQRS